MIYIYINNNKKKYSVTVKSLIVSNCIVTALKLAKCVMDVIVLDALIMKIILY